MRRALFLAILVMAGLLPITASGEEGGSGHYMPGGFASFIDTLPGKPAFGLASEFTYYSGSASVAKQIPVAGQVTNNLDATVYSDMILMIFETPFNLLGAEYALGLAAPILKVEAKANVTSRFGTINMSDHDSGVGDIVLLPLAVVRKKGFFTYMGWFGIYAPTGSYQKGKLANVGKNYWTFEPTVAVSYFSEKIGLEVTAFTGLDFNTKNSATDYQTGDQFHLDVTLAEHLPLFNLGIIGIGANAFYYKQITGDSGSGAVLGKFESRTAGIGPVVSYFTTFGQNDAISLAMEVKWLPELDVSRRIKGDIVWFKVAVGFSEVEYWARHD